MMPSAVAKKKVHHPKSTPPTLLDDGRDDIETAVTNTNTRGTRSVSYYEEGRPLVQAAAAL